MSVGQNRKGEEFSDGSCVHSSVFLRKITTKKKHCTSVYQLVLLQNAATEPIRSQDQTEGAGQVGRTALPEVHKGEGRAGSGRTGGGLYWTVVTASWMDWAT